MKVPFLCPRCSRAYTDKETLFCSHFTKYLHNPKDHSGEHAYESFGLWYTREARFVYQGWRGRCAGFRDSSTHKKTGYRKSYLYGL